MDCAACTITKIVLVTYTMQLSKHLVYLAHVSMQLVF
jgi:hypothetical protein